MLRRIRHTAAPPATHPGPHCRPPVAPCIRCHGVVQLAGRTGLGQTGVFSIVGLAIIEGQLPKRVIALVLEWAFEHRDELMEDWRLAEANKPLRKIEPLA
jgi:hypothetical protein